MTINHHQVQPLATGIPEAVARVLPGRAEFSNPLGPTSTRAIVLAGRTQPKTAYDLTGLHYGIDMYGSNLISFTCF